MQREKIEYIIVQAGGKGTRLQHLTANKPKALVPIDNRPMIFHLFEKFPDKRFIIIADYKADVMEKYLAAFAKVKYLVVRTEGKKGTCSGIKNALKKIPSDKAFMLIWSDLVLPQDFEMPEHVDNYVGLSKNFRCRWRYENNKFEEIPSEDNGVAGLFILKNKEVFSDVPEEGELVKWFGTKAEIKWDTLPLYKTKEFGVLEEYNNYHKENIENRCRPFNRLIVSKDYIIKEGIDKQGMALAIREKAWYRYVKDQGYKRIPQIISFDPFKMEKINGKNIFEYDMTLEEKESILRELINNLQELHSIGKIDADYFSIKENYLNKTLDRLNKIRDLVPFGDKEYIRINGKICRNVFFNYDILSKRVAQYSCPFFTVIHGDNTFSNMILKENKHPVLIDPRGYFGYNEIFGDPVYDWAKLYYSIVGNYDQFNLKHFMLDIEDDEIKLNIQSNQWEDLEAMFFELLKDEVNERDIKFIHAIIWLSLTTYAWEDYDSICGAFYNGLYYLEESL